MDKQKITLKSEYRRMINTNFWRLTIFEFLFLYLTMPIWCLWYQLDSDYFNKQSPKSLPNAINKVWDNKEDDCWNKKC